VVNLSKIEGMLKLLLSRSNFQSPISQLAETLEERKVSFETKTLGQLANEYFKLKNSKEHIHEYPEDRKEPWFSFSFEVGNEEGKLPELETAFKLLVSERNRLVHEMLVSYNPDSEESCHALISELDEMNKMIQREYKNLQTTLYSLDEGMKHIFSEQLKTLSNQKK